MVALLEVKVRRSDKDLSEIVEGTLEEFLSGFIKVEAEVVDPHKCVGADPLTESVPFGETQGCDGCFFLSFAGKEPGGFSVDE